jgi:hypothetical protein
MNFLVLLSKVNKNFQISEFKWEDRRLYAGERGKMEHKSKKKSEVSFKEQLFLIQ